MDAHLAVIRKFYDSFAAKDADGMLSCYHMEVQFSDPAFGKLDAEDVRFMWRMLLERGQNLEITYNSEWADEKTGGVNWEAKYDFGKTGRRVHNKIRARFAFHDGLIIEHKDYFNFWRWSTMALGGPGYLLGWSPILKNKVRSQAKGNLAEFKKNQT